MQLHNTLTRRVEPFQPIKPGEVTLYTCGPTVYNYAHIGNLRAFAFFDTLRRALEAHTYQVRHTLNITDVGHLVSDADEGEDKLEKGAAREGKTVWEVAEHYTTVFKHDMRLLGILPPNAYTSPGHHDPYARATEFIPQQIELVQRLLDKGFAYQTTQAIYFDVTRLPSYGELTGQKLADKEVAARDEVVTDPEKHHPYDFAVWFFTVGRYADHSMRWESPWGDGFPGWHLECSAIIHATLGDPIDIHAGGVDHIGTHHPNEMAQTEAAFDHQLANYWIHNEFILVDGGKMAKSKGNTYTLGQVIEHGYHPLVLRLLYLQAHYRTELNFSWEAMAAAQQTLLNLYAWADQLHQTAGIQPTGELEARLIEAIGRDLDTPGLLGHLFATLPTTSPTAPLLARLDQLLGLALAGRPDITTTQKHLITARETARAAKDWTQADELRAKLAGQQLEIEDTPTGPRWRRTKIA